MGIQIRIDEICEKKYKNGKLEYLSTTDERDQRAHHNVQCNRWADNFSTARADQN